MGLHFQKEKILMAVATKNIETREGTLDRIKSQLISRKNEILAVSSSSIKSRLSANDNGEAKDEIDLANASSEHWLNTIQYNKRNGELAQIDKALDKIQEGMYGICEECEEPIPEKRLHVRPFATMCVECQEDREKSSRPFIVRSISEEDATLDTTEEKVI